MKIVLNKCYGGFGLSAIAEKEYLKLLGKDAFFYKRDYKTKNAHRYVKVDENNASNYDLTLTKDFGGIIENYDWKKNEHYFYYGNIERDDKNLVEVVERLGSKVASGYLSKLEVVEIPDDISWEIDEYDGIESIHETHRSW